MIKNASVTHCFLRGVWYSSGTQILYHFYTVTFLEDNRGTYGYLVNLLLTVEFIGYT